MADFDAAVGQALRILREGQGLAVVDLVERTGIPGSTLEGYEAGAAVPSRDLRAISAGLGLSLPSFLGQVYPRWATTDAGAATPEEGRALIEHFMRIPDPRSRRFLIDMAHALSDYGSE